MQKSVFDGLRPISNRELNENTRKLASKTSSSLTSDSSEWSTNSLCKLGDYKLDRFKITPKAKSEVDVENILDTNSSEPSPLVDTKEETPEDQEEETELEDPYLRGEEEEDDEGSEEYERDGKVHFLSQPGNFTTEHVMPNHVIISDGVMKEALDEIHKRDSLLREKSVGTRVCPCLFKGQPGHVVEDKQSPPIKTDATEYTDSISPSPTGASQEESPEETVLTADSVYDAINELSGCPLEKLFEFLSAVMYKDYKAALNLAKEVEQHEPENTTIKEFISVLQKINGSHGHGEEEANGSESDSYEDVSSSDNDGHCTDEMTTSEETESNSRDKESSDGESRSTTLTDSEDFLDGDDDLDFMFLDENMSRNKYISINVPGADGELANGEGTAQPKVDNNAGNDD